MIEKLTGILAAKTPTSVILDVGGVGYGVEMPLSDLCELGVVGSRAEVWIETHVREDAIRLFGFLTLERKQTFSLLRTVSGVGPKIGLALLSNLSPKQLRVAVLQGRSELLESVPGIGKRLAERLVVELRPKIEKMRSGAETSLESGEKAGSSGLFDEFQSNDAGEKILDDLRSALENFGYKDRDINQVMDKISKRDTPVAGQSFEFVLKDALTELRSI
jgi:Holliday junction DNA helicase RuvA